MGTYWLGKNPDDSFTQKKVLTDVEQELRGIVGAKAMGRYAWNQTVGSLLGRIPAPARPGTPPTTTIEQVLRLPVVSQLLGRWLKVDNAGFRERMEAESKPTQQREAQINREVDAAVVLYQKTGKFDPMVRRNIIIGEQIYKAYRGHPPTVENRLKMHYFTRFKNADKAGKMARKPVEERIQRQQPTVAQRLSVRDAIRREQ
jgi:hypothetical protein